MKKRVISLAFCLVLMAFSCSTAYAKPTSEEIDAQARGTESHVTSIGNTIYYISGDWLYSISARGRNHKKELLVGTQNEHAKETTWGLQSYNGYLYYRRRVWDANLNKDTDRYNVYRYKPGGKPSVFQANVTEFIIGGNTLYYGTPSGLYIKSINLDTGKKDTLVQGNDKYKLEVVNFLEDVLLISVKTSNDHFLAMCNPKNKQLVEHRGLKWYDEHNTVQTRGSYLYDFDKDSGYLYRSTLNHSTLAITERRPFLYLARGLGFQHDDVFISGDDYVYYGKPDSYEGKIRWYRRDMSTGKITTLIYENATDAKSVIIPEPCANSLWRFGLEWVNAGPDCLDYIRLSEL